MYEAMPHQFYWCFLPSYTLFMSFACNVGLMFSESIVSLLIKMIRVMNLKKRTCCQ